MSRITVTAKGKRLLSSKWGVPYGLLLAYVNKYWWVLAIGAGIIASFVPLKLAITLIVVATLLVNWAGFHFRPSKENK